MVPPGATWALLSRGNETTMAEAPTIAAHTATIAHLYRNTIPRRSDRPSFACGSGNQAFDERDNSDPGEVVPGREHHEGEHQGESETKTVFLSPIAQRLPSDRLSDIEPQVSAVKDGDWEQVDQAEIDRQHRHEPDQRDHPALRDFAGHAYYTDRTAQFIPGAPARYHLAQHLHGAGRDVPGLLRRVPHRRGGIEAHQLAGLGLNAQPRDLVLIAEMVGVGDDLRRRRQRHVLAAALDDDGDRGAGVEADDLLNLFKPRDLGAVDRDEAVARLKPGAGGGGVLPVSYTH